jgi:hypothetical protein
MANSFMGRDENGRVEMNFTQSEIRRGEVGEQEKPKASKPPSYRFEPGADTCAIVRGTNRLTVPSDRPDTGGKPWDIENA